MNVTDANFGREAMNFNRVWISLVVVAFALTLSVSLASADYVVLKDKNGICKVIESAHKTPKTIAGPFKTKEEAVKAKEKECATAGTTKEKQPGLIEKPKEKAKEKEPGLLDKIKEKAKEKEEKAKEAAKEKAEKAKQALKEKEEKAKQKAKEKEEKAKKALKEKEEKAKEKK